MKGLLLDQGLPRSAAALLRQAGIDAVHVGELGMAASADASILEHARTNALVIVTLDADFHTQLALSGESAPSVIRVRVQGLKAGSAAELIQAVLEKAKAELQEGALVSVTKKFVRIKKLPIKR